VRKTNLPQENDTAHLLATARAQIEASQASTESLPPPQTRVKRALEIDPQDEREETAVPVKRARVEELEREVWVDGRRGRALLGLAIGLGARYDSWCCDVFWFLFLFWVSRRGKGGLWFVCFALD
jgi:hypothetical protein